MSTDAELNRIATTFAHAQAALGTKVRALLPDDALLEMLPDADFTLASFVEQAEPPKQSMWHEITVRPGPIVKHVRALETEPDRVVVSDEWSFDEAVEKFVMKCLIANIDVANQTAFDRLKERAAPFRNARSGRRPICTSWRGRCGPEARIRSVAPISGGRNGNDHPTLGHRLIAVYDHAAERLVPTPRHPVPAFVLAAGVGQDRYDRWLHRRALARRKRDLARAQKTWHVALAIPAYRAAIHAAVERCAALDEHTGDSARTTTRRPRPGVPGLGRQGRGATLVPSFSRPHTAADGPTPTPLR